ncbi:MAG: hypothetical protein LLG37_05890 [Spirochaetia bacterium]|nr:hypothetical protein [Spirochaetia bacterium]
MRYMELQEKFGSQGLFSVNEVRAVEPGFYRPRLNEWQKKGYIRKFIRNYYVFSSAGPDELFLFAAANRVYAPSYISMQSALAYYGLIPDRPLSVLSITSRKTQTFETVFARFVYRKCAVKRFWGYITAGAPGREFLVAEPAKAILDLLYLEPSFRSAEAIAGLRLDMKRIKAEGIAAGVRKGAVAMADKGITNAIREVFG